MIAIEPLHASGPAVSLAQALFRSYAGFLRGIEACHSFDFDHFEHEIHHLPTPYTAFGGDLLLARSAPEDHPIGCIAFRSTSELPATEAACEIKRLFVLPSHRGQGVAEALVRSALRHATARGFRTAMLDTEPSTMAPALALYRKLGFTEFHPDRATNPVDVVYLRRSLP